MEENKELQELKDDDLEQVTGGRTLPYNVEIHAGHLQQMVALNEFPVSLEKAYAAQLNKTGDVSKAIITTYPAETK